MKDFFQWLGAVVLFLVVMAVVIPFCFWVVKVLSVFFSLRDL